MKRVRRAIEVKTRADGQPSAYFDDGSWHRVAEIADHWLEVLPWWPGGETVGGEEVGSDTGMGAVAGAAGHADAAEVAMYRLQLEDGGLVEVERRPAHGPKAVWRLYRVFD